MTLVETCDQTNSGSPYKIQRAAVIGSGVMGSGIAAHLANVGIPCLLLDIVPDRLTEVEQKKGYTLEDRIVRNRLANLAIQRMKTSKPAPLYDPTYAEHIRVGNIEDDWDQLADVDWIIEVVVEHLDVKRRLFERLEQVWRPGTIVSSNTSGISIHQMVEGRSEAFQQHFLGTHFFNPPRYMKLLEMIPHRNTDPELLQYMRQFCESVLGKGVVLAKDTPNFIANRIGTYGLLISLQEMEKNGYTVDEIDAVTGPVMGRPKSATFRTLDLVGIDTFVHVANNVYEHVQDAEEKASFEVPAFMREMVQRGWVGEKAGQGFYQKMKTKEGSRILSLDLESLNYVPRQKITSPSLEAAKQAGRTRDKLKALLQHDDRYATLAWDLLKRVLLYSAEKVGEIADSIVEIDEALKWGFNWELGPFETWDALGLVESVKRMEEEGLTVPGWVKAWIDEGGTSFYTQKEGKRFYYLDGKYQELIHSPKRISLQVEKERRGVIRSNSGASLVDLGEGVACLEFHSPNNAIGPDILSMINQSMEEVRKNYVGLVIANEGKNFCVGANIMQLLMEAQSGEWDEVDWIIRQFQQTLSMLKYFEKPVIAAPHQMTLGGGVEVCMAADYVYPHAETYYGLVEVGVGLIPGGGGCKELALRASNQAEHVADADIQPYITHAFETVGMAKVSSSAQEAKRLRLLSEQDRIQVQRDFQLYEAKQAVIHLARSGYQPPQKKKIKVVGETGKAVLQLAAYTMRQAGYISEYDQHIANKLAHVLAGGDIPAGSLVTEEYLLDLEREAFLSLCGEEKTQQRIQHMLTRGKPLRN